MRMLGLLSGTDLWNTTAPSKRTTNDNHWGTTPTLGLTKPCLPGAGDRFQESNPLAHPAPLPWPAELLSVQAAVLRPKKYGNVICGHGSRAAELQIC